MKLLQVQPGQRVLDVACGQGVLCRMLHEAGAIVMGIDAAPELIRMARQRSGAGIEYIVGDAREIARNASVPGAAFDAAACVLAVQNIHPLPPLFAGMAHALRAGGRAVLAMMHPCFRGPKTTSWGWDDAAGVQFRRIDRYLLPRKEPIVTHPGSDPHRYTWTFHRPIQSYVKAMRQAGLLIDAMEEWPSHKTSQPGPRAGAENRARQEIPMFLAVRAVKV
jgi:ubiquinone/menaquinone biosynthesis C-methylase UbiE